MLVELQGKKGLCGIDAILNGDGGRGALRGLLAAYKIPDVDPPGDAVKRRLEEQLDEVRALLAGGGLLVDVVAGEDGKGYHLRVTASEQVPLVLPADTTLLVRPITHARGAAQPWPALPGLGVDFGETSCEGLTTFIAFQAAVRIGSRSLTDEFVLNLPSRGMPNDRQERMLRALLRDRGQVLRFLLLLLSDGGLDARDLVRGASTEPGSGDATVTPMGVEVELLEEMLRALERDPAKIDRIERFVSDLRKTPEGQDLLPAGLESLLAPILEVRRGSVP